MTKKVIYADTNIVIRYLTNDSVVQAETVEKFISGLTHNDRLYVSDLIIAEAVYVLQGFHERPRDEIADRLLSFCALPGVVVDDRGVLELTFDFYVSQKIDFTDAYLAARAQVDKAYAIFSFDKDFKAFDWLKVIDK